jgi:hypothetical protein
MRAMRCDPGHHTRFQYYRLPSKPAAGEYSPAKAVNDIRALAHKYIVGSSAFTWPRRCRVQRHFIRDNNCKTCHGNNFDVVLKPLVRIKEIIEQLERGLQPL